MVFCLLWITVALALVCATFSTVVAVTDHIDMVRLERRRKLWLGASGFAIGLLALLMCHAETVHPGSISSVLALVRRH
jgi:formate/nitrite transporter FocA (FNT family)